MKAALRTLLAVFFTLLILSSMISIMAIFMGGGAHPALTPLLRVQTWSLLPTAILIGVLLANLLKQHGIHQLLAKLWRATPGWIVFGFFLINSIVLIGELAIVIIMVITESTEHSLPGEHIPLLASLFASLGFWLNYHTNQSSLA